MSEREAPTAMSWEDARRLLKEKPGAVVSSLSWQQAGKCIFRAKVFVFMPEATLAADVQEAEQESIPALWFRDHEGRVGPYLGSAFGDERDDWIEGPSAGKPDAA
ncbi:MULTISPECIES: hypothetical protein [unclassified Streptomyces]|uniref:hypothetical protein n=1 Tax=unclassified Streptomyces TaxID=2593676 RepID=UPI002E285115|nr:hypothetical protein [Streptomyces sp. NBC_00285]